MSGVRSLKANFFVNFVAPVMRLAVGLITVPLYVHHIGNARYGVVSIVWALLGYAGFLDLGLSRAATNALARLRDAPREERARVLVTTLLMNAFLGAFAAILVYALVDVLLSRFVQVPEELRPEIAKALPWIASMIPMALVSGAGIGALESKERFALANTVQVLGMSFGQIAPVVLAMTVGTSLAIVIPATAVASALQLLTILAILFVDEAPLRLSAFNLGTARTLLGYGGWVTVSSIIGPILTSIDQLVVGSLLGVAAVAHYAVAVRLISQSQIVPAALVRTLFPRMSYAAPAESHGIAFRALTSLTYGYCALCAPAIVLAPLFFRFWMGAEFAAVSAPVAQILFIGAWINGLAFVPFSLLQSQGRPDITGKLHAIEVLPFTAILWALTSTFGLLGAAVAWCLRCGVDAIALFRLSKTLRTSLLEALPPFLLLVASVAIGRMVAPYPGQAVAAAAIMGLASVALALARAEDLRSAVFNAAARAARLSAARS